MALKNIIIEKQAVSFVGEIDADYLTIFLLNVLQYTRNRM